MTDTLEIIHLIYDAAKSARSSEEEASRLFAKNTGSVLTLINSLIVVLREQIETIEDLENRFDHAEAQTSILTDDNYQLEHYGRRNSA